MPFDNVHGFPPSRPSGVAAAVAAAADVARNVAETTEPRQVDQSCCGGRQEPAKPVEIDGDKADVEEGWREIGPGEILQAGDEVDVGVNCRQWVPTQRGGVRIGDEEDNYRRRVAPQAQPIEITPAAASAMCERNARDALLKKIENLRAENHEQQEKILQGCLENERLRSEVKLFVPEAPQSRPAETRASRIAWATPEEELAWFKKRVKWLDGEVERLRLRPEEILSCKCAEATLAEMPEGNEHSDVLWAMLARLRGDS